MPGIKVHLLLGSLFYPLFYVTYFFFSKSDPIDEYGVISVVFSYFLFVVGSDLPDIDADFAPVRYFTHSLLPFIFIYSFYKMDAVHNFMERFGAFSHSILVLSAVLFGFALGYFLKLLKHRGFLHSIRFSLLYGGVIYALAKYGMFLSNETSFFLALSGSFGVIVHLILDKEVKF